MNAALYSAIPHRGVTVTRHATRYSNRCATLLALFALSGCASGSGGAPSSTVRPATQTIGRGDIGSVVVSTAGSLDVTDLPYTADAVWGVLPSVYDSLAIPISSMDPARKEIGNSGYRIRSRLGKVSLSRYLDCGSTQIGPNADNYDVVLTVLSVVAADGASASKLTTSVEAQARPATYNQGYSRCTSKGGIETRIAELTKARLSK